MGIFRSRLPSRRESVLLFAASTFPVYSWSMLGYFRMVPAWDKYLGPWDIGSILAYVLAVALVESILVFFVLVLLRVALPRSITHGGFVSKASTFLLVDVLWALVLHNAIVTDYIRLWTAARYLLCAMLYVTSVGVSWALVHRWKALKEHIEAFVDRLTVLPYIYIPLSALGVLIVIARNIL